MRRRWFPELLPSSGQYRNSKPQNAKPITHEIVIASLISRRMLIEIVLTTISFDDEPMLHAHEVDDIAVAR
jgi:hypothetical protein